MSLLTIFFASAALAASMILTIHHLLPHGKGYLFGNAMKIAIVLEVITLLTTILSAGTISSLLINSIASLFIGLVLSIGYKIYGGTNISWSYKNIRNGSFGFTKTTIIPAQNQDSLAQGLVSWMFNTFDNITLFFSKTFSLFGKKLEERNSSSALSRTLSNP